MSQGYPVMLRLAGRRCVVVGGGTVAARKIEPLVEAGADVLVVAPEIGPVIAALAETGSIRVERRPFEAADLDGASLAIAATDQPSVNRAVAQAARERGVLVNVADDPDSCDFTVPASIRRADVTLAISTDGRSPAFARHLRAELEDWLSPERCALLVLAAEVRHDLRALGPLPDPDAWQRALDDAAVRAALSRGDREGARARLLVALRPEP